MEYNHQQSSYTPSRRRVLGLIAAGFFIPLAGCLGDDDDDVTPPDDDDDSEDLPLLRDVMQWESSYQMWHAGEDHILSVLGDDFRRSTWDADDVQTDQLRLGNQVYLITDPHWEHDMYDCVTWTEVTDAGLIDWEQLRDQHGDVRAVGRTSLLAPFPNNPVYRFNVEDDDLHMDELYLEIDTGYPLGLRNVETGDGVGFHSWGEDFSFEPPTDCRSA